MQIDEILLQMYSGYSVAGSAFSTITQSVQVCICFAVEGQHLSILSKQPELLLKADGLSSDSK